MDPVIVTGAAGFIGSAVARRLLDQGRPVFGIDDLHGTHETTLHRWRLNRLLGSRAFTFIEVDITDAGALDAATSGIEAGAIMNLAARAGVRRSLREPQRYLSTNGIGTINLLELAIRRGIDKFVLASTSSVYGSTAQTPFIEDDDSNRPLSPYAASKKAAEALCHSYHHVYGIDVTICRFFTVYGPAGRPDMSPFRFIRWIVEDEPVRITGDGRQSRDFTYVDDVAAGAIAALAPTGFHIVNLGSDRPYELLDLVREIERATNKSAKLVFTESSRSDVHATHANIDRARRLLGWEPKTRLSDGVAASVHWYLQEREWAASIPLGD